MSAHSVFAIARRQLDAIGVAVGLDDPSREALVQSLELIARHSIDASPDAPPRWSAVSDDCSPLEWSVAFGSGPAEVRLLFEAQADPPSPTSYWAAADKLEVAVCAALGGDRSRRLAVDDLLTPGKRALFAALHSVEARPGRRSRAKVYLNPCAHSFDPADVAATIDEALSRWGFTAALGARLRAQGGVEATFVALDLEPATAARIKVYCRARDAEVVRLLYSLGVPDGADDVDAFLTELVGSTEAQLQRPANVALHYVQPRRAAASHAVVYLPLVGLVPDSAAGTTRIAALHRRAGLDPQPFLDTSAALDALTNPDLSHGLHNHVSLQREGAGWRITVYFGLRAFAGRFGFVGLDPSRFWPSPV